MLLSKSKSKSLQKQTGLNDGMINYTLDFEFAYDMINNVIVMSTDTGLYRGTINLDLFQDETDQALRVNNKTYK